MEEDEHTYEDLAEYLPQPPSTPTDEIYQEPWHKPLVGFQKEIIANSVLDKSVLDELISKLVMSPGDREEIVGPPSQTERNKILLDILIDRPYNTFGLFGHIMEKTDKQNVDIQNIVKRMKRLEPRLFHQRQIKFPDEEDDLQRDISVEQRMSQSNELDDVKDFASMEGKGKDYLKARLQKNFKTIVQGVDCTGSVCDLLIERDIVTIEDQEEICSTGLTRSESCRRLLTKLLRRDSCSYHGFLDVLRETGVYAELADRIDTTTINCTELKLIRQGEEAMHQRFLTGIDQAIPRNVQEQFKKRISKWQEADKMFVHTNGYREVMKCIQENSCVVVTGNSGTGKTFVTHHVALKMKSSGYYIVPASKPEDLRHYFVPGRKMLFVIDDICGRFTLNKQFYNDWKIMSEEISSLLEDECCKIIATCRLQVYRDERMSYLSFFKTCECNLNSNDLRMTIEEQTRLARMYLKDDFEKIELCSYDFFPLLCRICTQTQNINLEGFFKNPFGVLKKDLDNLPLEGEEGKIKYCGLVVCVLYYNSLKEDDLLQTPNQPVIEQALIECGLTKGITGRVILNSLLTLQDVYISAVEGKIRIHHDKLFDFLGKYIGDKMVTFFIQYSKPAFIRERFAVMGCQSDKFCIEVPNELEDLYINRIISDWKDGYVTEVFSNENMRSGLFRQKFTNLVDSSVYNSRELFNVGDLTTKSTAMIQICSEGHVDNALWALEHEVNITGTNEMGISPIYIAAEQGHTDLVRLLSKHTDVDINQRKNTMATPLMAACFYNRIETVNVLLENPNIYVDASDNEGRTAFYLVCLKGNTLLANILLQRKVDINKCKLNGASPFYIACEKGHIEIVKVLLGNSIEINRRKDLGGTPLYAACYYNKADVVRELLEHCNVDVNVCHGGHHLGKSPLFVACLRGNIEVVRELLHHSSVDVNKCSNGVPPLCIACKNGNIDIVKELLQMPVDINQCSVDGQPPFYIACENGYLDIVKLLLKHKDCKINACTEIGESPLFAACSMGHTDIVIELLKQSCLDVNLTADQNPSPLYVTCQEGYVSIFKELISHPKISIDKNGLVSLICVASRNGHTAIVERLLQEFKLLQFSIDYFDIDGYSPFICACHFGHVQTVKLLIAENVNIDQCDAKGKSPLLHASKEGHIAVVRELLQGSKNANKTDYKGRTPLYAACKSGHIDVLKELLPYTDDVNAVDNMGRSALFIACELGQSNIVNELCKLPSVNVGCLDYQGKSPLQIACQNGHFQTVAEFLPHTKDVNACDQFGESALFAAANMGYFKITQILIDHSADVNSVNKSGFSILCQACMSKNVNVVKQLISKGSDVTIGYPFKPMEIACMLGSVEILKVLLDHYEYDQVDLRNALCKACYNGHVDIIKILTEKVLDLNFVNSSSNKSPLYIACEEGHLPVVKELLSKCFSGINERYTVLQLTPLYVSCQNGFTEIAEELIMHGADIKQKCRGLTPKRVAKNNNHYDIVNSLKLHSKKSTCSMM